ncbi:MAG: hypothetical protein ABIU95_08930 [Burkholderiales bacterium]
MTTPPQHTPIVLASSGGKDSVLALAALRAAGYDVRALLSTFTPDGLLVMHRVPRSLVASQAASLGLPLIEVQLPDRPSNAAYEARMTEVLAPLVARGIRHIAFGDLFLEEIRSYREVLLARLGLTGVYPLWGRDTRALAHSFVGAGFHAIAVCVDIKHLDASFAGRPLDTEFFDELPPKVDPCGENGEFHSFVYDGPGFAFPVPHVIAPTEQRTQFAYALLEPGEGEACAQCGALFTCGAMRHAPRCWCMDEPRHAIDPSIATCLCPRCLRSR